MRRINTQKEKINTAFLSAAVAILQQFYTQKEKINTAFLSAAVAILQQFFVHPRLTNCHYQPDFFLIPSSFSLMHLCLLTQN